MEHDKAIAEIMNGVIRFDQMAARRIRNAVVRQDRLAIATLTHDRRYVPEPADHHVFSAPLARYRRWTETELRHAHGDR